MPRRIVVAITGASGALYARRAIQLMLTADVEVHLVVSPLGQRLLHDELGMEGVDLEALSGRPADARGQVPGVVLYNYRDVGAAIASGSFIFEAMLVLPCSNNSLAAIATGQAQNLIHRAANVCLKERRKLVVVHRETPLSLIEIRNMAALTEAGGIICPANPGFYLLPKSIDDIVDFMVARILDLLLVPHDLSARWGEKTV